MPLGINPLIDFAFKITFGKPENRESLIGLLNAVLKPKPLIVEVTIENPFNFQDFHDDKLSVLDVRAVDAAGVVYNVEVQLGVRAGLLKRLVFYGCELYAGQIRQGASYADLPPVYCIWLIDGLLWPDAPQFHHAFRLTDAVSRRILDGTLAIHTIELPKYNSRYQDLVSDDLLGWWLYWLRHAPDYEADALRAAFPQPAIRRASETLIRIAEISEDKAMYDAREKATRDRQWELDAVRNEGKLEGELDGLIKGEVKLVRMLQGLLNVPPSDEKELGAMGLNRLESLASSLQEKLRTRTPA